MITNPETLPKINKNKLSFVSNKKVIDPVDEVNLEAAQQFKKSYHDVHITAACVGDNTCKEGLQNALAIGANEAILLKTNIPANTATVAKLLRRLVVFEGFDLVICGKQSSDLENCQVGCMLAGLLNWIHLSQVYSITRPNAKPHKHTLEVACDIENGQAKFLIKLPCVLITDVRIAVSRFASLSEQASAKLKKIRVKSLNKFNLKTIQLTRTHTWSHLNVIRKQQMFKTVPEAKVAFARVYRI